MLSDLQCKLAFMGYGERLASALKLAGKDRRQLAEHLGVSVQAIGQVISGKTKQHTAENATLSARFLDVDVGWLTTGKGLPRQSKQATSLSDEENDLLAAYRNVPEDFRQDVVRKVFEMADSSRKIVEKILRDKYGIRDDKPSPGDPGRPRKRAQKQSEKPHAKK